MLPEARIARADQLDVWPLSRNATISFNVRISSPPHPSRTRYVRSSNAWSPLLQHHSLPEIFRNIQNSFLSLATRKKNARKLAQASNEAIEREAEFASVSARCGCALSIDVRRATG